MCEGLPGFDLSASEDMLGVDLPPPDLSPPPKRVFVTSKKYTGDLKAAGLVATNGGPISTGLEGGDALCQTAATDAGLGGTWKAWLSDSTTDATNRIVDVGPWYLVGGPLLFANKFVFTAPPAAPINRDEHGTYIPAGALVWTGTLADGTKATQVCAGWTSASIGTPGELGCPYGTSMTNNNSWGACGGSGCDSMYPIYCFEQ
jgi:hypothetical protein